MEAWFGRSLWPGEARFIATGFALKNLCREQ